ncbi:thioesterase [Bacillus sp. APMAM]|nr:thioesterase [Bacillus sp. APMAM]
MYNKWGEHFVNNIEVIPIELAGRGSRFHHGHYRNMDEAVSDVFNEIFRRLKGEPYAIFGHSMGAYIAYEVLLRIMELNEYKPCHIFVSGKGAPCESKEKAVSALSNEELFSHLIGMGGVPEELLNHKDLAEIFLQAIRNDYRIIEEYNHEKVKITETELTVLMGTEDMTMGLSEAKGWRKYTDKNCSIYQIKGNHFFINHSVKEVVNLIEMKLSESILVNT